MSTIIICSSIALLIGGLISYLWMKSKHAKLSSQLDTSHKTSEELLETRLKYNAVQLELEAAHATALAKAENTESEKNTLLLSFEAQKDLLKEKKEELALAYEKEITSLKGSFEEQKILFRKQEEEKVRSYEKEKETIRTSFKEQKASFEKQLNEQTAAFEKERTSLQANFKEQRLIAKKQQEERIETMKAEFQQIAQKIFEEKSKTFSSQTKDSLGSLLNPLTEHIKSFKERINTVHKDNTTAQSSLANELKTLRELNQQMSEETNNLTKALKGDSKLQGDWGEMILENILENSGLRKGEEYFTQKNEKTEDGKNFYFDVVVHYPGNRDVIIDSKTSLTAYAEYMGAEDRETKKRYARQHLVSVKKHIDELAEKDYSRLYEQTFDFVMLFIPNESACYLAMQEDKNLWNYAYKKKVIIMSPTNLITALRLSLDLWQRERQAQNIQKIIQEGSNLYDKLATFTENYEKLGNQLSTLQRTYTDAEKQLSTGSGNLVKRVNDMRKLGLTPKKQLTTNTEN